MSKTPIDPSDIQAGDLVRREQGNNAQEWRVGKAWKPSWRPNCAYYLLDRPNPRVDLPAVTIPQDSLTRIRHEAKYSSDFHTRNRLAEFLAAIDEAIE